MSNKLYFSSGRFAIQTIFLNFDCLFQCIIPNLFVTITQTNKQTNKAKQSKTKQNKTKQNKTKQNKTKQNKTKQSKKTRQSPKQVKKQSNPKRKTEENQIEHSELLCTCYLQMLVYLHKCVFQITASCCFVLSYSMAVGVDLFNC